MGGGGGGGGEEEREREGQEGSVMSGEEVAWGGREERAGWALTLSPSKSPFLFFFVLQSVYVNIRVCTMFQKLVSDRF